jgi:hypothetical protein
MREIYPNFKAQPKKVKFLKINKKNIGNLWRLRNEKLMSIKQN